jgi:hypothetical protein
MSTVYHDEGFKNRLDLVEHRIEDAAQRAGRTPADITLIAVSKTHPVPALREALRTGLRHFGENRVQEAEQKIPEIGREVATWHLIGHLQANKARKAVQLFDTIHSLDSVQLADRLDRICSEEGRHSLPVLIQVDLAGEATKSGVSESELDRLIEAVGKSSHLALKGLMVLPPFFENPEDTRPFFRRLRELGNNLERRRLLHDRCELSMGMSHDFEVAIEEGATMVRVGTAIFGSR